MADENTGASETAKQNYRLRMKLKEAKEQAERDKAEVARLTALIPAEGTKVLTPEAEAELAAYRALGKPDELTEKVKKLEEYRQALAAREADDTLRDIADKVPGLSFTVLKDRLALAPTKLEAEEKDGQVTVYAGEGDARKPLREYAEAHWKPYVPALFAEPQQGSGKPQPRYGDPKPPTPPRPSVETVIETKRQTYGRI